MFRLHIWSLHQDWLLLSVDSKCKLMAIKSMFTFGCIRIILLVFVSRWLNFSQNTNPFAWITVAGVSGSAYPSVNGVGVLKLSLDSTAAADGTDVGWAPAAFLVIFDLVSRPGNIGPVAAVTGATATGFGGGASLILDLVTRCGGVSTISLSSSSSSSSLRAVVAGTTVLP